MKAAGKSCVHLGFLLGTIISFCLEGRANMTMTPLTTTESPSASTHETTTSSPPTRMSSPPTTLAPQETTMDTMQTTTPLKSSSPETSMPSFASASPSEATASSFTLSGTGQEHATPGEDQSKAELCEEGNKRLLLICLIVIGVLVFICVCLLMIVVVMASKLSFIKRRQPGKRLPRSNGDFLSASSLWPAGLETLQRMANESSGTNPTTSSLGPQRVAAGQGKTGDQVGKMLASIYKRLITFQVLQVIRH
uniref:EVI2A protein n=1 Tax=Varanus komodoensis TaxID=61221 RepID=A0A8D2LUN0_VARKO